MNAVNNGPVDVHLIFRDFNADPEAPASYDFHLTYQSQHPGQHRTAVFRALRHRRHPSEIPFPLPEDRRPCPMNGMFDFSSYRALKGYYPIKTWGDMRTLGTQCETWSDIPDVYVIAATGEGEPVAMITYYTDEDNALPLTFTVEMDVEKMHTMYLLDETHDMEPVAKVFPCDGRFQLTMKPNTVIVLK